MACPGLSGPGSSSSPKPQNQSPPIISDLFHVKSPQVAPPKGLRPQQSSPNMRTNARENLIEEDRPSRRSLGNRRSGLMDRIFFVKILLRYTPKYLQADIPALCKSLPMLIVGPLLPCRFSRRKCWPS